MEWVGDRATGIIAARRGEEIRISADNVVVAAGTAHSAQLLYASNVRPEALDRYLVDHPLIQANVNLQRRIVEELPDDDPPFTVWIPYSDRHPFQVIVLRGPPSASVIASSRRRPPAGHFGVAERRPSPLRLPAEWLPALEFAFDVVGGAGDGSLPQADRMQVAVGRAGQASR